MKIFNVIVSLLLFSFAKCAPNVLENAILQNRLKSELHDKHNELMTTRKAQQNTRREILNENKKKRCELCRESKRCKVQGKCELCNVVCKDIDTFMLQTSENPLVGETPNNVQDATNSIPEQLPSTVNSERFYTVGNVGPGPKQNVLARLLDIPKKDNLGNLVVLENPKENAEAEHSKHPVIIDTANIFKTNEQDAEIFSVDNSTNHIEPELMSKIDQELDMATEEKKRLFNESKLTKNEISKIISHAKSLHQRKGVNPEIHLRSRSIADLDNTNTPAEEAQDEENNEKDSKGNKVFSKMNLLNPIDANRSIEEAQSISTHDNDEKEPKGNKLFGNRNLLKPKFTSFGLRRKLKENSDDVINGQFNDKTSAVNQGEPENSELFNQPKSTNKDQIVAANTPNKVESESLNNFDTPGKLSVDSTTEDVLQLKHEISKKDSLRENSEMQEEKGNSITSDQFTWILKNLEKKVENIADLVRKTCGQPVITNAENITNPFESNKFPIRKNVVTELPIEGFEKSNDEVQKGIQSFVNKVVSAEDDKTGVNDSNPKEGNELVQFTTDPTVGCSNEESEEYLGNAKNKEEEMMSSDKFAKQPEFEPASRFKEESANTPKNTHFAGFQDGSSDKPMQLNSRNEEPAAPSKKISEELFGEETPSENMNNLLIKNPLKKQPSIEHLGDKKLPHFGVNNNPLEGSADATDNRIEGKDRLMNPSKVFNEPLQQPIHTNKFSKPFIDSRPNSDIIDSAQGSQLIQPITQNTAETLERLTDKISHVANGNPILESTNPIEATDELVNEQDNVSPALEQRFGDEQTHMNNENKQNSANAMGSSTLASNQYKTPIPYMLGKIIPQENGPGDKVIFVSNGMPLPFNMKKHSDGSYQLSMDVEKLCHSCHNGNCQGKTDNDASMINSMIHSTASIENDNQSPNLPALEKDQQKFEHSNVQKISSKVTSLPLFVENDSTTHHLKKRDILKRNVNDIAYYSNNMHKKRKPLPPKSKKLLKAHYGTTNF